MVSTIKLSLSFSKCTKPHELGISYYLYYPKSSHTYTLDFSSQYLDNAKGSRCLKNNNNKFHSDVTICFVDKEACVTLCSRPNCRNVSCSLTAERSGGAASTRVRRRRRRRDAAEILSPRDSRLASHPGRFQRML